MILFTKEEFVKNKLHKLPVTGIADIDKEAKIIFNKLAVRYSKIGYDHGPYAGRYVDQDFEKLCGFLLGIMAATNGKIKMKDIVT